MMETYFMMIMIMWLLYMHKLPNTCSVSPGLNIKGGGVHQWYMTFGQQCSISVVKQCFSA